MKKVISIICVVLMLVGTMAFAVDNNRITSVTDERISNLSGEMERIVKARI